MSISGNQAQNTAMLQHEAQSETLIALIVNGRKIDSEARTLAALIEERGLANAKIATAVNGQFVPEARRATTALDRGDRVEILSARQGG